MPFRLQAIAITPTGSVSPTASLNWICVCAHMCRMRACYIALVPRACSCILVDISVHHVHVASIYQGPLAPLCVVVNSAMIMNDKMTTVHIQAAVFILGMVRRHKSWRYVCACTLGPRRTGPTQRCSYSCGYSLRPQIASISGRSVAAEVQALWLQP